MLISILITVSIRLQYFYFHWRFVTSGTTFVLLELLSGGRPAVVCAWGERGGWWDDARARGHHEASVEGYRTAGVLRSSQRVPAERLRRVVSSIYDTLSCIGCVGLCMYVCELCVCVFTELQSVKLLQITQRSEVQFPARMLEKNRTVKYSLPCLMLLYSGELHVNPTFIFNSLLHGISISDRLLLCVVTWTPSIVSPLLLTSPPSKMFSAPGSRLQALSRPTSLSKIFISSQRHSQPFYFSKSSLKVTNQFSLVCSFVVLLKALHWELYIPDK